MRVALVALIVLVLSACSAAPPPSGLPAPSPAGSAIPADTAAGSAMPSASAAEASAANPSPNGSVGPPVTFAPDSPAPTARGVIGPVVTGDLATAFPPVIAGERVTVTGPMSASDAENLDQSTLNLIEQLGLDPEAVEMAIALDTGASVIILALRAPGVDAATLDGSYVAVQEAASGTSNFRVVNVAGRNVRAFDSLVGTTYAWVSGNILFTVYGTEEGAPQAIAALPVPTVQLEVGGEVTADAIVDLVISNGPHVGTYHGETSSGGCSRNALGENSFGLQYSDDAATDGFTSLQLIVSDNDAAEAGSTDDFVATVQIGPMFDGTAYNVDPRNDDGTGSVQIERTGTNTATAMLSGETADGVALTATVICNVVFDFGS